jgi:undecaprenyl-diphosphatase
VLRLSNLRFAAIAVALLLAFVLLFAFGGADAPADRAILYWAQRESLVAPARFVTRLADWTSVLLIAGSAALWLAWRRRRGAALLLIALLLSERLIVELLKKLVGRDRPDPAGHLDAVHSLAFPSGHSANAMTLGLGLALLLTPPGGARAAAVAAALLFALLVGVSRMVLGVHWPSDVAGGWLLGALWTVLLVRLAAGTGAPRPH